MGGTRSSDARLWRILHLPPRNLRPKKPWQNDFVSLYLAALVQRTTFDRLGSDWFCQIHCLHHPQPGDSVHRAAMEPATTSAWSVETAMAHRRHNLSRHRNCSGRNVSAL